MCLELRPRCFSGYTSYKAFKVIATCKKITKGKNKGKHSLTGRLVSPYRDVVLHIVNGNIISNRFSPKLLPAERKNECVYSGLHSIVARDSETMRREFPSSCVVMLAIHTRPNAIVTFGWFNIGGGNHIGSLVSTRASIDPKSFLSLNPLPFVNIEPFKYILAGYSKSDDISGPKAAIIGVVDRAIKKAYELSRKSPNKRIPVEFKVIV